MNPDSIFPRSTPAFLAALAGTLLTVAVTSQADNTPQALPFSQNWANAALINVNDDWSGVPGIIGYRGDGLTGGTGVDPQTVVADGTTTPVDVNVNQTMPGTFTTGGVTEFELGTNNVVAFQGSGTARAPFLLLHLNTTGKQNIVVSYKLLDIDGSTDNSVQPVALQYRNGSSGDFTNIPAAFVADASTGPSLATNVVMISATLPAVVDNQALVEVRIITTDAVGADELIGIDDISVTGDAIPSSTNPTGIGSAAPSSVLPGESSVLAVTVTPGTGPASTGLAVTGDLSSIGGSPTQAFRDDGMGGDTNAADNVFTYVATVTLATPVGGKTLPFTVSDAQVRSSSGSIALTVAAPTPPAVTTQPQSQTVWENTNVAFSVTANGTAPLAYQWRFGGTPIGSATNTSLLLSNVTTAQNGGYDVVVTNLYGSTTSMVATLTVMPPIATNIAYLRTLQDNVNWTPTDTTNLYRVEGIVTTYTNVTTAGNAQFYFQDATAGISVFVSGSTNIRPAAGDLVRVVGPMGHFNGLLELNLVATNPTHRVITLSSGNPVPAPKLLHFSDTNDIALTETNLEGSLVVVSNQFLDVSTPTFTSGSNVTLTNTLGELFTLRIDARVTSIIGQTKPAATRAIIGVLAQSDTTAPHTANYQILPTRLEDIVPADPPSISVQPQGGTILTGSTFTVSVTAAPSYATYQWYFNGGVLGGQTASNLTLANVTPANSGPYFVVVSTLAGSITSSVATVTVFTPQTVLSIDIEERAAAALVYPGFTAFLIDSNISTTAKQTNASVRTIGGITVSLSGSGTDPGYDDRVRTTPVDAGAFTQSALLRDFIFSADTTTSGGLNVGLTGLTPNQVYAVTIWSFDSGSPGNRVSDWTANGTLVKSAYTFNGSTLPTTDAQSQFTFKVAASASGQITIQGRRNPATASAGGVFLNAVQVATALPDPPTITSQPVGTTISAGDNAQFSVGLGGTAPFSFQWRRNGSPLSGGTNATLVVFSAQAGDAGPYDVVATNPSGSITSSVAQLIVTPVANITTGLISHWPLNVLGLDTPDVVNGYSLNATNMDASNLGPGQCGLAPTFNGTDEYLTRTHTNNADLPVYSVPSYTVTLWVKGNFAGQGDRRVYAESSTTNNTPLFTIGTDNAATSSVVDIFIRTDANVTPANHRKSSLPAFDGQWHHIAWVDSLGFGRLYVDGVLDTNDFNYARAATTMNTVTLGAIQRATAGSFFNGMIDNVAVWRRALSSNEVVYVRRNGPTLSAFIVCPPDTTVYTDPDQNVATHPNLGNPDLSGNCSVTSVTNNAPASLPLGETLVTWTATDQNSNTATCVQHVTVVANRSPVAGNNGGATSAGIPARFPFVKLLANDSDPDGDTLTISAVTPSTNGASVTISNQTVIYTPQPGFTGTDRFNYTASDGHGGTAVAMVEVFVASGDFPPLNLVLLTPTANGYLVRFAGVPGRSYDIQRATNVSGPWTTLVTAVAPLHGIIEYEDTQPPQPAAFYRTVAH